MKRGWKTKVAARVNPIFRKIGFECVSTASGLENWRRAKRLIAEECAEFSVLDAAVELAVMQYGKKGISVVQIGANDGTQYDLVRKYIERYSMQGVLVEPNPAVFGRLKENYVNHPQLKFENVAIGETEGAMSLYFFAPMEGDGGDYSVYASLDRAAIERIKMIYNIPNRIQASCVPVMTLSALLDKHPFPEITLLAIDTEGYDMKILQTIDFEAYKPRVIVYEHTFASGDEESACLNRLIQSGYKICRGLSIDTVAVLTPQECRCVMRVTKS